MAGIISSLGQYLLSFLDPVLNPLASTLTSSIDTTNSFITSPKTHRAIVRSIVLSAVFTFSVSVAVVGYTAFYWVYIPERGVVRDVEFQFGFGGRPFARVDLGDEVGWLASDQVYDVTLDLVVPTSERNMEIGNFMVSFELKSMDNRTLVSVSKPASLHYESPLSRTLRTFLSIPSLLTFSRSQIQYLSIPILTRHVLRPSNPPRILGGPTRTSRPGGKVSHALVRVGRDDGYVPVVAGQVVNVLAGGAADGDGDGSDTRIRGEVVRVWEPRKGEIQVYESKIRFDAHFEGLRWIMYHHPFLSFLVFASAFLWFEMVSALAAWGLIAWRRGTLSPFEGERRFGGDEDDDDVGGKLASERRREGRGIKREDEDEDKGGLPGTSTSGSTSRARPASGGTAAMAMGSPTGEESTGSRSSWEDLGGTAAGEREEEEEEEGGEDGEAARLAGLTARVKSESDEEDVGTIGGSSTSRGTSTPSGTFGSFGLGTGTGTSATTGTGTGTGGGSLTQRRRGLGDE